MGTPTVTWDATYELTPAGTDDPRAADDRMREMKLADRERGEREHGWATSEASARHGIHRKGSARASYGTGDPTTVPDGTSTRALNSTDDDGRLHVDATTKQLKVYDGSAWGSVQVAGVHLKILDIGDWNMMITSPLLVAHGLDVTKIVFVSGMVRNDDDTIHYPITPFSWGAATSLISPFEVVIDYISSTNVHLMVRGGGMFDHDTFDSTSYNRGWLLIWYTD